MKNKPLYYPANATFQTVLEDGLQSAVDNECEGFEYIVGEIRGGKVKVTFEPDSGDYNSCEIDGVDGFGYALVCETDKKIEPKQWTDAQVLEFLSVGFRHVDIKGDVDFNEIRQGLTAALSLAK